MKSDLLDPRVVRELEKRVRHALKARRAPVDHEKRIAELRREIANLTDAIASGLLKSSPTLAERLSSAERELEQLQRANGAKPVNVDRIVPRIAEQYRRKVAQLDAALGGDVERARAALQDVIGSRVTLQPDESGKFL